jgi:hypothetical protein
MRVTVGQLREAITGMDDRLTVIVRRGGEFDNPVLVNIQRAINSLVLEVEDDLGEDYLTLERSHDEECTKLGDEIQALKAELAKLKEPVAA